MKVKVKEIDEAKNSVLLEDEHGTDSWFALGEKVKMMYVKIGDAEATVDVGTMHVTYLKMEKVSSDFQKSANSFGGKSEKKDEFPVVKPGQQEGKYYKTKHKVIENVTGQELETALDLIASQNWVIATQTHFVDGKWSAVVYIKYKE